MKASYDALGYHTDVMPINCKSRVCSSMCTFGCVHGDKQDGVQTYLKDAVQSGARIITGCTADSLITEQVILRLRFSKRPTCNVHCHMKVVRKLCMLMWGTIHFVFCSGVAVQDSHYRTLFSSSIKAISDPGQHNTTP